MLRGFLLVTAVSFAALPAPAQSRDPIRQVLADFDRIDANGDGDISRAEYRAFQIARWPQIDRNADGVLTLDDFPRSAAARAETLLAEIAYLDKNRDGRISRAEFTDGPPPLFRSADLNDDNLLTRRELETAASG